MSIQFQRAQKDATALRDKELSDNICYLLKLSLKFKNVQV